MRKIGLEEITENETKENGVKGGSVIDGKQSSENGIDETETSDNIETKSNLTDAMFISNLLEIMPNKPKIKKLEEENETLK